MSCQLFALVGLFQFSGLTIPLEVFDFFSMPRLCTEPLSKAQNLALPLPSLGVAGQVAGVVGRLAVVDHAVEVRARHEIGQGGGGGAVVQQELGGEQHQGLLEGPV